jgi:hypothetical protein
MSIKLVSQERPNPEGPWFYRPVFGIQVSTGTPDNGKVVVLGPEGTIDPSMVNLGAWDAELAALASVTSAANLIPYFTGPGTASTTTFTQFGRDLVGSETASSARSTLGLGSAATMSVGTTPGTVAAGNHTHTFPLIGHDGTTYQFEL